MYNSRQCANAEETGTTPKERLPNTSTSDIRAPGRSEGLSQGDAATHTTVRCIPRARRRQRAHPLRMGAPEGGNCTQRRAPRSGIHCKTGWRRGRRTPEA